MDHFKKKCPPPEIVDEMSPYTERSGFSFGMAIHDLWTSRVLVLWFHVIFRRYDFETSTNSGDKNTHTHTSSCDMRICRFLRDELCHRMAPNKRAPPELWSWLLSCRLPTNISSLLSTPLELLNHRNWEWFYLNEILRISEVVVNPLLILWQGDWILGSFFCYSVISQSLVKQ